MFFGIPRSSRSPARGSGYSHPETPEESGMEGELCVTRNVGDSLTRSWAECGLRMEPCLELLMHPKISEPACVVVVGLGRGIPGPRSSRAAGLGCCPSALVRVHPPPPSVCGAALSWAGPSQAAPAHLRARPTVGKAAGGVASSCLRIIAVLVRGCTN